MMNAWGVPTEKPKSSLATLAEKLETPKVVSKIETVKVDGLVLLKIMKHATECLPDLCYGTLLGLDTDFSLEVTNCVASPDLDPEDSKKYQLDMLKLLRDINMDVNPVGVYHSTDLSYEGSFATMQLIEGLFRHQDEYDRDSEQKFAAIIFDPLQSRKGKLSLKAYRLSDTFMDFYRGKDIKVSVEGNVVHLSASVIQAVGGVQDDGNAVPVTSHNQLSAEEIFEEIPIEITNSHLFTVLVEDLKDRSGDKIDVDFDRFNLSTNPHLEQKFELLLNLMDKLSNEINKTKDEQRKISRYEADQIKWIEQRRVLNKAREERGENRLPEVDPTNPVFKPMVPVTTLESMLIRKQINMYCDEVNKFVGAGFSKLYLANAVQE